MSGLFSFAEKNSIASHVDVRVTRVNVLQRRPTRQQFIVKRLRRREKPRTHLIREHRTDSSQCFQTPSPLAVDIVFSALACQRLIAHPPPLSFQSNIPAFWSWANPSSEPQWERAVNVDMIMNMEIMLWAAVNGGDAEYSDAVEK